MTKLFAALIALSFATGGAAMAAPAPQAKPAVHQAEAKPGAKPVIKTKSMKLKAQYVGHLKKLPRHHAHKVTPANAKPATKPAAPGSK